jgi:hypothetical protein
MKKVFLLGVLLLCAGLTYAQDSPKLEVSVDYSYVHANPQNNNIIPTFSLNGGGGAIAYYFTKYIGVQGEFQGYGSYTRNLVIPAGNPACGSESNCLISAQGNLFTYNVGPIVKFRTSHFEPFVEAMFGGAHTNFYGNIYKDCVAGKCTNIGKSPSNNAFDFIIGGGIDIPLTPKIAIRPAQVDYLLTRFGNSLTAGNNNQSNFRYQAGVVIRF